ELRRLQAHGGYAVDAVRFSPDGKVLASVGRDGFVTFWDTTSWRRLHRFAKAMAKKAFVVFSPDGKFVACDDGGNTFSVWEATTGKLRHRVSGHEDEVTTVAFGADGNLL